MTAEVELLPCGECGMPCRPGEYHPYAACLMFKTCRNSDTVRGNLQDAQDHATAAKDAEVEALRAEVEMLRDAFSDEDMTAGAHWFGRYVEQKRRAEQLAEEVEALRAEVREAREFSDKMANAIGSDQLRRFIEKHGEPVPLTIRMQQAEARAERLAEALRQIANQGPHYGPDGTYKTWRHWAEIARAALEQEAARG